MKVDEDVHEVASADERAHEIQSSGGRSSQWYSWKKHLVFEIQHYSASTSLSVFSAMMQSQVRENVFGCAGSALPPFSAI